ncbi:flagellar basal body L-ring protein FlgH [Agaribacter flavus]|uniref:Flagellar basal body L-ring protein FlgH n=1 Tax=Agaribacter flavus TaxID=1902781 RepID=A0ABV7FMI3_9ALTE
MFRYSIFIVFFMLTTIASAQSLYDETKFKTLYADKKALNVGDGITILVYQSLQATSSAGEVSEGQFGFTGSASVDEKNWNRGLSLGSSNEGNAGTNRNGFVRAQLTAVVIGKFDEDTLVIEGTQKITVNEEQQTITIKGNVRLEDISSDNVVPSFRVQNAEILIEGEGEVTSGKNGNVFTRFIEWLGF